MKYRYFFHRRWAKATRSDLDTIVWVLLNPGTGDTDGKPRRTLAKCINWSTQWGYASLTIVNLFALRSTDPKVLRTLRNRIDLKNDATIRRVARQASRIVVAWGAGGAIHNRGKQVTTMLPNPYCLGVTARGEPLHPLYLRADTVLRPYP